MNFEEFGYIEDAERYIRDQLEDEEDELYLVTEYEDVFLVFFDEYDLEDYLAEDYQSNAPELAFEQYVSDISVFIYVSEEEKNKWASRYDKSKIVFDDATIYKRKIHAGAEYDIRVSLGYY